MADQISICNMALAEIVAKPIESLNERSIEARETGRYYQQCLTALLESHAWGFATVRVPLSAIVNPRPGVWPAAFAMPIDVARPLRIAPASLTAGNATWWLDDEMIQTPFAIEGSILFSSCTDPIFAYVSNSITAASLSARFVDALVFELASRIVMPIKKSREMKADLLKQAEVAKQRAMADDDNRQPAPDSWSDQVQLARDGWAGGYGLSAYVSRR